MAKLQRIYDTYIKKFQTGLIKLGMEIAIYIGVIK